MLVTMMVLHPVSTSTLSITVSYLYLSYLVLFSARFVYCYIRVKLQNMKFAEAKCECV